MLERSPHQINLTRLQRSAHHMMAMCFWKNSVYGSSSLDSKKNNSTHATVRVAYFKNLNWFGFNFCKYHPDAVEIFIRLPSYERYFYEVTLNKYTSFKIWCIDSQHFDFVVAQLQRHADIELEFVVSHQDRGLVIPEPFTRLGLTFRKRGERC